MACVGRDLKYRLVPLPCSTASAALHRHSSNKHSSVLNRTLGILIQNPASENAIMYEIEVLFEVHLHSTDGVSHTGHKSSWNRLIPCGWASANLQDHNCHYTAIFYKVQIKIQGREATKPPELCDAPCCSYQWVFQWTAVRKATKNGFTCSLLRWNKIKRKQGFHISFC